MTDSTVVDAVVIGAGAAGLYAAAILEQNDCDVVVLEARDRIGGRLLSAPSWTGPLDLGATWFWANEQRICSLIADAGLASFPQHLAGDMIFQTIGDGAQRMQGNQLDSPSGRLVGGMASVPELLAGQLHADTVKLSATVTSILPGRGLDVATPSHTWSAEHVILAVPPALAMATIDFGDHLSDRVAELARATPVWMGSTVKAVAVFDRPFWRDHGLAGAAFSYSGPMREIHDMSGPDGSPAALFGFCPVPHGDPAPTEQEVTAQLVELFGDDAASPSDVVIMDWRTEPFTSPPNVEHLTNYQTYGHPEFQKAAMDSRLHWASTETSPVAPGHIEGALAAAERAATAVLSSLAPATSCPETTSPGEPS